MSLNVPEHNYGVSMSELRSQLIHALKDPNTARDITAVLKLFTHPLTIFAGPESTNLAEQVCSELTAKIAKQFGISEKGFEIPLGRTTIRSFKSGALSIKLDESVRDGDVHIIQSLPQLRGDLSDLIQMVNVARRSSAHSITVIIPYLESRQDRQDQPRTTIGPRDLADDLETAGTNHVITIDPHFPQISGMFKVPFDMLYARAIFADHIMKKFGPFDAVCAPDAGAVKLAGSYATYWGIELVIINKRRPTINVAKVSSLYGDVDGKRIILIDDNFDTGGTASGDANFLVQRGAATVYIATVHGLFSTSEAIQNINNPNIQGIMTTNTLNVRSVVLQTGKVFIAPCESLIAETIKRIHLGESISTMFTEADWKLQK